MGLFYSLIQLNILKEMTDLVELWLARTMDIRARRICYRRIDLGTSSLDPTQCDPRSTSISSTLYFQHQPLKISMTHCQKPLWANSSLPENCLFKWAGVFSRLEWCFTSSFPWPIWVPGAEKQQEMVRELRALFCWEGSFSPHEQSRKTTIQKPVLQ